MKNEEFYEIAQNLEKHHGLFSKLWTLGLPIETKDIPTACVEFKDNRVEFIVNPVFWNSCSTYKKVFVVCHECLHVFLEHGIRIRNVKQEDLDIANQAMDISVNHMLVNSFGFQRKKVEGWENLCWVDTIFNDEKEIPKDNMHFEYYFNLLKKNKDSNTKTLVDIHSFGGMNGSGDSEEELDNLQNIIEDAIDGLSDEEKKNLGSVLEDEQHKVNSDPNTTKQPGGKHAGTMTQRLIKKLNVDIKEIKKKKKWETVIKNWASKFIRSSFKDKEQWARINRRFTLLNNRFFLPTEMETDSQENEKNRIKVWFFLDTSGSCCHLSERFFRAAMSLPQERFLIELFCFDTEVYEVDIKKQKLQGFGGTSFSCINNYIESKCKNKKDYPKAVFIVTDGWGNYVNPRFPEKWYWFLSEWYTAYLPQTSKKFKLSDYE